MKTTICPACGLEETGEDMPDWLQSLGDATDDVDYDAMSPKGRVVSRLIDRLEQPDGFYPPPKQGSLQINRGRIIVLIGLLVMLLLGLMVMGLILASQGG